MIGALRGTVLGTLRADLLVEVQGVAYRVSVTAETLTSLLEGQEVLLYTHEAVRETADDLYGFLEKEDLVWFELLLTVSGIGPKSALAIMNAVDRRSLTEAIARNDAKALSGAFGIGKKTAEKIVLELKEKVGAVQESTAVSGSDGDVVDALVGLGYSVKEARDAVRAMPRTLATTEEKIREAIKIASRSI
jgi:holliday junction DNA helicase RuvA